MYVCICNGVTDTAIREAAADGVRTLAELTRRTGCAGTCGGCAEFAQEVLQTEREKLAFPIPLIAVAA